VNGITTALTAAVLLGTVCGLLGTFVVVRRMALTGDMLSHAVLPGIVLGLALDPTRNPLIVLLCAVAAGVAGSWTMAAILRHTRLKADAALALVLSVFFALGIALISRLQPAGVHAFLYGQIAAIDRADLGLLVAVCAATLVLVPLMFRVLSVVSFDSSFSRLIGLRVRPIEVVFYLLLSVVIVVAMQAVGVVLVTAMLVTPAAASRFCTNTLHKMAAISCVLGALGGVIGVWISASYEGMPTGPLMALAVTGLFVITLLFGKRRGLLPTHLRKRHEAIRILGEDVLKKLWHSEELAGRPTSLTEAEFKQSLPGSIQSAFRKLRDASHIGVADFKVSLTPSGRKRAAELVRAHRLWERYLTERGGYKPDHVHEPAERAEHWLDEEGRRKLEENLGHPTVDPHGSPIPTIPESEVPR
jgi:manganese/zinc/iron transport system permease protein